MADLVKCPEELRHFLPSWQPLVWPLFDKTPESLLKSGRDWLAALAAVRVVKEDPEQFWKVYTEVLRRLEPLSERDRMRWQDLMWFLVSWALRLWFKT
jgi:hypothetical protein